MAAEAYGVHAGMRLGEALARCPRLMLVPPDPAGVADFWERLLVRLESIGAAVEPERPGLVCFDAAGLLRLHGGLEGVLAAARRALKTPARFGVASSRFAAVAAATKARVRRPEIVPGTTAGGSGARDRARAYLAPLPVALLRARPALADLPDALERLGVGTLGELAKLPAAALADRFGANGLLAHDLASGGDGALRPRPAAEFLRESLELPEAGSGIQLERALGLLIDRLLARRERRGRTLRAVVLSSVLVEQGGTWREQVVFREALADPVRMRLALDTAAGGDAGPGGAAAAGGRALWAAGERSASAAGRSCRGPGRELAGGDSPGSRRRWSGGGAASAGSRSRLALSGAQGCARSFRKLRWRVRADLVSPAVCR